MQPAATAAPSGESNCHLASTDGNGHAQQHHDIAQLQHFMQAQLSLALANEEGNQLDGKFAPNAIDAGLFSPSQQSRSDEATIGADCGQISEPARLLATAFLLDQPETSSNFATMTTANGTMKPEQNGELKETESAEKAENIPAEESAQSSGVAMTEDPTENSPEDVEQERRTSDLIRKQLAEIEKEIARRMQNKNVKKMDELEMSQLLLNHGLVAANFAGNFEQQKSALPPCAASDASMPTVTAPSLDQLRQSFSPQHLAQQQPTTAGQFPGAQFFPQPSPWAPFATAMQFAAAEQFAAPVQPQHIAMAAAQSPFAAAPAFPYSTPFLPQQQQPTASQSPSPPMAQMLPPNLSAITPEMAAALLAQLQQQNPTLLQSIVQQQQAAVGSANRISATAPSANATAKNGVIAGPAPCAIPAPPRVQPGAAVGAKRNVQRRASLSGGKNGERAEPGGQLQRQNSAEWAGECSGSVENGTAGGEQPVWVMRESYLKRREREEQRRREHLGQAVPAVEPDETGEDGETDRLLLGGEGPAAQGNGAKGVEQSELDGEQQTDEQGRVSRKGSKKEVLIHEPAVLIEGVLFRARYLGSTQMSSDGRPTKSSRMAQAQEAVARVKAPEGEPQPSTEIDLFISTEKIMVLNTDLQRISETDVRQDILMDHSLRSISYIADIGDLVVLMARRVPGQQGEQPEECDGVRKAPRVICHVFESEEANFIAQSIGQAFQVAYVEFLRANGIEDPNYLRDIDYQEVLNSQEMMAEELELLARKETQKDVVVAKRAGEALGVVIVESGWGSMLPTSVIANMAPGGAAARSNQLNIGDQIIGVNGISLVGLPLSAAQQNIKNAKSSTAVRLTVVSTPPVVEVRIRRPDTKYQLGFSVQNGVICSLLRGGIAERGGIRVGHRIIEINHQSVVAVPHERIVNMLATATGEIHMKTMPTSMFRLLTGQEVPNYI